MTATVVNAKDEEARTVCARWAQDWGGLDGAAEPTAGQIIRAMARAGWYGHSRSYVDVAPFMLTGSGYHNGWVRLDRPATVTVHANGKSGTGSVRMVNADRAARLAAKYGAFHRWMTETRHRWQVIETVSYADNSTEVVEQSQLTGATRRRMTIYPHGDIC